MSCDVSEATVGLANEALLILQPFRRRFTHVTGSSPMSPDEPSMLKREWGSESNGKLPHLFTLRKNETLVSEFAVEDLPLDRTATLVPEFCS